MLDASWFVGGGALALVILLFPDGALPSPRWRWVLRSYLAVGACYAVITYAYIASTPGHDVQIGSGGARHRYSGYPGHRHRARRHPNPLTTPSYAT